MSRQTLTGSSDVITISPAASINNLAARTIMGWVKPSVYGFSFGAGDGTYWSRTGSSYMDFLDVALFPSNGVYGGIDATGDALSETNIPNSVPVNTWTHLAMTYNDGGDRKIHFFINGVESTYDVFTAATGTLADDSAANLEVGRLLGTNLATSTAKFYDFRIYNSILTPTELATIVAAGHTVDPQPTHNKCQLTFATDQGATEPDASGNGNTGAITSATFSSDNPSFIPPPTITQISPAVGNQSVNHKPVTVSGSDFDPVAAVLSFSGAGVTVDGYASRSATQIQAFISIDPAAGATARDVIVTNGDTQADTLSAAFTVVTFTPGGDSGPTSRTERIPRVPRRGMV